MRSYGRIFDPVAAHAQQSPDAPALLGTDLGTLDYASFQALIEEHARQLLDLGVRPGDRVACLSHADWRVAVSFFATASIGGIWLGLNPRSTASELGYVLADAEPQFVMNNLLSGETSSGFAQATQGRAVISLRDIIAALGQPGASLSRHAAWVDRASSISADEPALIVYTSGSTGTPKGALIRHSGLSRLSQVQYAAHWGMTAGRTICNLPINHIAAIGDLLCVPLLAGGALLLLPQFDVEQIVKDIEHYRLNGLFQVPTQLQRISARPDFLETSALDSLEVVGWGGAPLPRESLDRWRQRGVRVGSTYGMTEATSSITYSDPGASDDVLLNTVGRPDPDLEVRFLGQSGWCRPAEGGEICIRHPTLMAGYWRRPEQTAEAFTPDGWFRTGDVGYIRPDGNLVISGRLKEMFKSGGYNVYPREIEQVLERHPAVQAATVVPRPDADFYEVGVAFVQLMPGGTLSPDEARQWCRTHLAGYKVPKAFRFTDQLPQLAIGKVDRAALRRQAGTADDPE
ncbi:class I adenylate-forming enzyme family protein [Deinococcus radiopugnans]|uniref:class I adenylate-forming enzyme family protein n=1 Tax=Deinococcus radiopugnans TaxID=57497 RepID=UPI000690FE6A|nr:class I adenylate-forming enzyme family protein [Deinococcus radiopugnans]